MALVIPILVGIHCATSPGGVCNPPPPTPFTFSPLYLSRHFLNCTRKSAAKRMTTSLLSTRLILSVLPWEAAPPPAFITLHMTGGEEGGGSDTTGYITGMCNSELPGWRIHSLTREKKRVTCRVETRNYVHVKLNLDFVCFFFFLCLLATDYDATWQPWLQFSNVLQETALSPLQGFSPSPPPYFFLLSVAGTGYCNIPVTFKTLRPNQYWDACCARVTTLVGISDGWWWSVGGCSKGPPLSSH